MPQPSFQDNHREFPGKQAGYRPGCRSPAGTRWFLAGACWGRCPAARAEGLPPPVAGRPRSQPRSSPGGLDAGALGDAAAETVRRAPEGRSPEVAPVTGAAAQRLVHERAGRVQKQPLALVAGGRVLAPGATGHAYRVITREYHPASASATYLRRISAAICSACRPGSGRVPQQVTSARLGVYRCGADWGGRPGAVFICLPCATFLAAWASNKWRALTPRPLCRVSSAAAPPGEWPPGSAQPVACDQGRPA
jgi:hypothetical protein